MPLSQRYKEMTKSVTRRVVIKLAKKDEVIKYKEPNEVANAKTDIRNLKILFLIIIFF